MPEDPATRLWYDRPAAQWVEALPLGNGRLGAMVHGGFTRERIALNEETLWSGQPVDPAQRHTSDLLPEIRRALAARDYPLADDLSRRMQGRYNESYQPLGDLLLDFHYPHAENFTVTDYQRDLDLTTAIATVAYAVGEVTYRRSAFVSAPDQIMALRFEASVAGALNFDLALATPHPNAVTFGSDPTTADAGTLWCSGNAPWHVAPSYYAVPDPIQYSDPATGRRGMAFAFGASVQIEGGSLNLIEGRIAVRGATSATVLLTAATGYNGWQVSNMPADAPHAEVLAKARTVLDAAATHTFEEMRARHIADHAALFDRVRLDLGVTPAADLPTDERIARFARHDDSALVALLFHYGRYLLIASSRAGGQPANLQGIWNEHVRAVWSSNWTTNINAQMNYWHAESTNLAECHEPLFDLIAGLAVSGARTARDLYGCDGWCVHHNVDLWRQSDPPGDYGHGNPTWSMWPMAGVWLCQHLWRHFTYSGDVAWLRDFAWPILREAAHFGLSWLIDGNQVGREEGWLVTAPATTPENNYHLPNGYVGAVSVATTMDIALLRDLFGNCLSAIEILKGHGDLAERLRHAIDRLPPFQVGKHGQLQEWLDDWDRPEDHHRHLSHLFGVHPGNSITATRTPALVAAARRSLELRGDDGTGWSKAWKINFWARLGDGDRALRLLESMFLLEERDEVAMTGGGLYANLFDAHPPFQIDGNFGATAGIVEMLLQTHDDAIHLLPALPAKWRDGSVTGLRAPGGIEVDIAWRSGRLATATLTADTDTTARLRIGNEPATEIHLNARESFSTRRHEGTERKSKKSNSKNSEKSLTQRRRG